MRNDPLVSKGLATYGAFVRVAHPEESDIGYMGSYIDDDTVALEAETRASDVRFLTRISPDSTPTDGALRRSGEPVTVYLDGALLRTAEWRGHPGDWAVTVPLHDAFVEIATDSAEPQSEVALVTADGRLE